MPFVRSLRDLASPFLSYSTTSATRRSFAKNAQDFGRRLPRAKDAGGWPALAFCELTTTEGAPSLRFWQGRVLCSCSGEVFGGVKVGAAGRIGSHPSQRTRRVGHPLYIWCLRMQGWATRLRVPAGRRRSLMPARRSGWKKHLPSLRDSFLLSGLPQGLRPGLNYVAATRLDFAEFRGWPSL